MDKQISLCLTNYNRFDKLIASFENVIDDDRISEIIISDDRSDDVIFDELKEVFARKNWTKIKLHRNDINIGMSLNKAKSIGLATNPWCIIFDSDNILDKDYIDAIYDIFEWKEDTIYQPEWAYPDFDFRAYSGKLIGKETNKAYLNDPMYSCFLNACNYFVHRRTYIENFCHNPQIKEVDTMWHNYNHLKNDGMFYFVPDCKYIHTVHAGSGWLQNANENMEKAEELKKMMVEL